MNNRSAQSSDGGWVVPLDGTDGLDLSLMGPFQVDVSTLPPGTIVARRFEVIEQIGSGGMGTVYKVAHQLLRDKVLALKVMKSITSREIAQRFQQEARALCKLKHPHIVALREFGVDDHGVAYMAMDYVEGTPLSRFIRETFADPDPERRQNSIRQLVDCAIQVCDALEHAHNQHIYHRDLKPSNIMVTQSPSGLHVTILDFGIAKVNDPIGEEREHTLTRTGDLFGSPPYMSPEQCLGHPVDERSDLYSLGCVMFEALTGAPPYLGRSPYATMSMHIHQEPPSLNEGSLGGEFPGVLDEIVSKLLQKKAELRFQTAGELKKCLMALRRYDDEAGAEVAVHRRDHRPLIRGIVYGAGIMLAVTAIILMSSRVLPGHRVAPPSAPSYVKSLELTTSPAAGISLSSCDKYVEAAIKANRVGSQLDLSGSDLTDGGLRLLSDSDELEGLNIAHTKVTDAGCRFIPRSKLQYLDLSGDHISDSGARELCAINNLCSLNLSSTGVTSRWIVSSTKLQNLRELNLNHTPINDSDLINLANWTQLTHLLLEHDDIDDGAFPCRLSKIESLDLRNTKITDKAVRTFTSFSQLRELYLSATAVSSRSLDWIGELKYLIMLDLASTRVTDAGLERLSRSKDLRFVDLSATKVTDRGIQKLLETAPWIQRLYLQGDRVSDTLAETIGRSRVVWLNLRDTDITDRGLLKLVNDQALREIAVDGSPVTERGIEVVKARCPRLKVVSDYAPRYPLPLRVHTN
jgi:tRNA A-37 threonylcarbamoyl transferase component Bud32